MQDQKWYVKLLIVLLVIVFSPLILAFVLIWGICLLFQRPKIKKEYKSSQYYADFKQKFFMDIVYSPEFRFYNGAVSRGLPIQYIKQDSNGFEYVVFQETVFLFPDFEQMDLNEEKTAWHVDYDGDWKNFLRSVQ